MATREYTIVNTWIWDPNVHPPRNTETSRGRFSIGGASEFSKYIVIPGSPKIVPVFLRRQYLAQGNYGYNRIYSLNIRNKVRGAATTIGSVLKETCNSSLIIYQAKVGEEEFHCGRGIILDKEMMPLLVVFVDPTSPLYSYPRELPYKVTIYLNSSIFTRDTPLKKYICDKLLGAIVDLSNYSPTMTCNFVVDDPKIESYFVSPSKPTGLIDNAAMNAKVRELLPCVM